MGDDQPSDSAYQMPAQKLLSWSCPNMMKNKKLLELPGSLTIPA
jgi:hypothetical protein